MNSGEAVLPLQDAYDAAQAGDRIQARSVMFVENLLLNRPVSVTLSGGYDSSYASAAGISAVRGKVTLQHGTLIVGGLVIK
ncbi:MAG: hypothetical protein ACOYL3_12055 [Desulfuromonadaceae bacterium]